MSKEKIYISLPSHLIQTIRLSQALMESDFRVCIKPEDDIKYLELKKIFGIKYNIGLDECINISSVSLSHAKPMTSIGSIERPLIFPHAIVLRCKTLWRRERHIRCSFAGFVTKKRKTILYKYIKKNYPNLRCKLSDSESFSKKIKLKFLNFFNIESNCNRINFGDIVIWSSKRGRSFPIKSWDEEYYRLLADTQFVLCPDGDFVWTYRFFEATLCGAIPVVENTCSAYEGFRFKTMDEPLDKLIWSTEDAEHNYNLCVQRLTIPLDKLNSEIKKVIDSEQK